MVAVQTLGGIIALIVIVAAFVLALIGQLPWTIACFFIALGFCKFV